MAIVMPPPQEPLYLCPLPASAGPASTPAPCSAGRRSWSARSQLLTANRRAKQSVKLSLRRLSS